MDWLTLGLALLAVASNIEAQQGYNYPKPKTPFGDVSSNITPGSQPGTGTQRPFGTQQPSDGVQSGTPSGAQRPTGGYSGAVQPDSASGTSSTFGTPSGTQRPFGTQQPGAGYSGGQPSPFGGTSNTFNTQPSFSGAQQPSAGYSGGVQTGTSGTLGTQQPSAGYSGKTQPGTSGGIQRPFETQGPSIGYVQQPGVSFDRPFGSRQPSTNAGQPGAVFGTPSVTQGPFATQQPSYSGIAQGPLGGQSPSVSFPGAPRFEAGRRVDSQGPEVPSSVGTSGGLRPETTRPGQRPGLPSTIGRPQDAGPSTGSQQGYNYPSPQSPFSGAGQTATGATTVPRPGETRPASSGFGQRPSTSPSREGPSGGNGFIGNTQFSSSGDRPSGTSNGYTAPGLERPTGQQFPSTPSRPTSTGQQTLGGYPESGRPQSSFSSGSNGVKSQYPSSSGQGQVFPGKQGRGEYSGEETSSGRFPIEQGGYTGSEGTQAPSGGVTQPSGSLGGQGSARTPSGQFEKPKGPQFPSGGSTQVSGPSDRPGFPGRTPTTQFPSGGIQEQSGPLEGQRVNGYPSSTTSAQPSGSRFDTFPVAGRPSRPELPSITSQGKPSSVGYQQNGIEPLSKYLPPEQPGTGGLPLADVPTSRFPSDGFTSTGSPLQPGRTSVGGYQRPSGLAGQSNQPQNGFGRFDAPTGTVSNGRQPSVSGVPQQPTQFQNGYGTSDISTGGVSNGRKPSASGTPSGVFGSGPTGSQNGYGRPDTSIGGVSNGRKPSASGTPSEISQQPTGSQNGYGTSGASPGSQVPSGLPESSSRTQNGYDVTLTGGTRTGGRPFGSQFQTTDAQTESGPEQRVNGYGKPSSPQQVGRPGSAGRSEPGYSLDQAIQEGFPRRTGGRAFPGFQQGTQGFLPSQQQGSEEEGDYNEEDEGDFSAIPGQPGRDYPILSEVPETSFTCDAQEFRGYYADVETRCQIFHICANNKTYDFICPNGTVFHQENLVCVWWNQFDCETAPSLYRVNEHIYDFSIFGAQQTGGIPFPGQDFPEYPEGQPGFPLGRAPGAGVDRRPQAGVQAPGYPSYSSQRPQTPRLLQDQNGEGPQSQASAPLRPSGSQASIGSTGYPSGTQQTTDDYQGPTGASQRPDDNGQKPGGYPSDGSQGPVTPSSTGYPSRTPQGTGDYQGTAGASQRPDINGQRPGGYSSDRYQGSVTPSLTGYPSKTPQASGDYEGPTAGSQRPGGYPSDRYQGSATPSSTRYPSKPSQGTGEYQGPTGGSQRPDISGQRPGGYPSGTPQGTGLSGAPQISGSGIQKPVGSQGTGQYQTSDVQRPGSTIRGSGEQPQGSTESSLIGLSRGSAGRELKFPTGSDASQASSTGQRPGQYGREGISSPSFPSGSQRTTPGGQYTPEGSRSQEPSGYSTGTSPRPGFPSGSQSSTLDRLASPFPGSPQLHAPTREYLPSV